MLDAGNLPRRGWARRRSRSGCISPVTFSPVHEPQRVGVLEHRAGLDDARAGLLDIGGVDCLQPRDLLVLVGDQGRPVEGSSRNGPAEAGGVLDLVADVRAETRSFFGTQPRITQVPPIRYSSAIMTLAPWPAAIRAARTPPEPPPMTNRSTSNSAISAPRPRMANREWRMQRDPRPFHSRLAIRYRQFRSPCRACCISARNSPLMTSANCCAHWFI